MNLCNRLKICTRPKAFNKLMLKFYSIYEPDYLELLKPKYPVYPALTVQIRGYDYEIIESYQRWSHKIARAMDFVVEDSYAFPAKEMKISKYKPNTTVVEIEYLLKLYERDLKLTNVPAVRVPIFIRVIEKGLPEGVMLDIFEYSEEREKKRYIPDKRLLDLKAELVQVTTKK